MNIVNSSRSSIILKFNTINIINIIIITNMKFNFIIEVINNVVVVVVVLTKQEQTVNKTESNRQTRNSTT